MGAYVFLIVSTGIWIAFGWALLDRRIVVDRTWGRVRGLPLLAKPVVWVALLPWLAAPAVGESNWRTPRARRIAVGMLQSPSSSCGPPRHSSEEKHVVNATTTRTSPITGSPLIRHRAQVAYGVLAAALLATILALLIGSEADWWPAVVFALVPDLAVLYGIAPGLAPGQLHPRAVPLHNALHRLWGPLALIIVAVTAELPRAWLAAALAWGFHITFDRAIGLRLRSPDGFQRTDQTSAARFRA